MRLRGAGKARRRGTRMRIPSPGPAETQPRIQGSILCTHASCPGRGWLMTPSVITRANGVSRGGARGVGLGLCPLARSVDGRRGGARVGAAGRPAWQCRLALPSEPLACRSIVGG